MRILSVHNFYYITGGADRCFFELNELLASRGHEVIPFSTKNPKNVHSIYEKYFVGELDFDISRRSLGQIKSLLNMMYSFSSKRALRKLINEAHPDVAHLHNIYARISPSILPLLKERNIPIVQTIHDYKYVCPNHAMFSKGSICDECKGGKYYRAFLRRCSHGSAVFSGVLALESYLHRRLNMYEKYIDAFIAPSKFMMDKLVEHGMDGRKIALLPNFINAGNSAAYLEPTIHGIYFGSLTAEKGVEVLIRSLTGLRGGRFKIIGDGYMKNILEKKVRKEVSSDGPSIEFTGHLAFEDLKREISRSVMVIAPSVWYENSPMTILEAFSQGKPVIGSRIGGIPELIKEGETGLLFEAGDSFGLREKILEMLANMDRAILMGKKARKWVKETRNPEDYFQGLMTIYDKIGVKSERKL